MSTATMTLLFTDIAASTEIALRLGDAQWQTLLAAYRGAVRRELHRTGGHEVDAAGDGFFAVFRSPETAVSCARAIAARTDGLGLPSRTGVHVGTCQCGGEKVSGINVHVAARVMSAAAPGEILVSESISRALPSAAFFGAGARDLKGLPGEWQLYRVNGNS